VSWFRRGPSGACHDARDRGASDVLALVLLAPVVIGLALLVVSLGRQVDSRAQVQAAAESAAQAAALQRTAAAAERAALDVAAAMLVDADTCADPMVAIDLSRFVPGGAVAVTVQCHASQRGVEPLGASAQRHAATATAAIDPYRSTGLSP
jgi:Flp pilus assembly protein TadG